MYIVDNMPTFKGSLTFESCVLCIDLHLLSAQILLNSVHLYAPSTAFEAGRHWKN